MDTALRTRLAPLWPLLIPSLLAGAVFWGVTDFGFVAFDDDLYVTDNPLLTGPPSLTAAFGSTHADVWIPVTWLSFQADQAVWGRGPAGHHRTNLLLHGVNCLLAGLLAWRLTRRRWLAALAAALFAVHPLNVEAVAWVTARKDLLAGCLALAATVLYAGGRGAPSRRRALAAAALGVAAMLAKPAAVVIPAWFVLVDWWFAADQGRDRWRQALCAGAAGKLVLVAAALAVALIAARLGQGTAGGAGFGDDADVGLLKRLGHAAVFVLVWLRKLVWPTPLAVYYPPATWRLAAPLLVAAGLAVLAVTGMALARGDRRPTPAWAWLWFLAGVGPALGILRGGQLLLADRYVYLPMVGIALAAAAGLAWLVAVRPRLRIPAVVVAAVAVGLLATAARQQAGHWRDSRSLWTHALAVTEGNAIAHQGLGLVLDAEGRPEAALGELEAALALRPHSVTHFNTGNVLLQLQRPQEAEHHYRRALALDPGLTEAALNLGSLLGGAGRLDEARAVLVAAEARAPRSASLQYNLGLVAHLQGDRRETVARLRRALDLDPEHAGAAELLGRLVP